MVYMRTHFHVTIRYNKFMLKALFVYIAEEMFNPMNDIIPFHPWLSANYLMSSLCTVCTVNTKCEFPIV